MKDTFYPVTDEFVVRHKRGLRLFTVGTVAVMLAVLLFAPGSPMRDQPAKVAIAGLLVGPALYAATMVINSTRGCGVVVGSEAVAVRAPGSFSWIPVPPEAVLCVALDHSKRRWTIWAQENPRKKVRASVPAHPELIEVLKRQATEHWQEG